MNPRYHNLSEEDELEGSEVPGEAKSVWWGIYGLLS